MGRYHLSGLLLSLLALVSSGAALSDEKVTVLVHQPTVEIIEFDPANPPEGLELGEAEDAACRFSYKVDLRYRFRYNGRPTADGVAVRLHSLTFIYTLDLKQTIYVPTNHTQKLLEHEQGHRRIGEAVYAKAEQIAREVAAEVMAKQWDGTGVDEQAAAQAATDSMFQEALNGVVDRLTQDTQRLNDEFDELTAHGSNGIDTDAAVKKILLTSEYAPVP